MLERKGCAKLLLQYDNDCTMNYYDGITTSNGMTNVLNMLTLTLV